MGDEEKEKFTWVVQYVAVYLNGAVRPHQRYVVSQNTFCVSLLDTTRHLQDRFLLPDVLSKRTA